MKISLVLATVGRYSELKRFLDSLVSQKVRGVELIIVDQSSDEERERIKGLAQSYSSDVDVRYFHSIEKGLSKARNIGLVYVSGDIVGFPDDDCWYPQAFLTTVFRVFDEHPNAAYLCGQYTEPGVINKYFPQEMRSLSGFADSRFGSSVSLFVNLKRLRNIRLKFDESLGAGAKYPAGEETDLMSSMILAGNMGIYDPDVCAFHMIERGVRSASVLRLRSRAYGYWLGKHSNNLSVASLFFLGVAKLALRSLFNSSAWPLIIERFKGFADARRKLG